MGVLLVDDISTLSKTTLIINRLEVNQGKDGKHYESGITNEELNRGMNVKTKRIEDVLRSNGKY